jgi:hypothetical protein
MDHRRIVPRQRTDWHGKYMIEGDPDERWRECRVIDVSTAGAGLELLETTPDETRDRRIVVAVQLRGSVRNSAAQGEDGLRAGVQFVELSEPDQSFLSSAAELQATS